MTRLHDAWRRHDRAAAKSCASDTAVGDLFGTAARAGSETFAGCDETGGPPVRCAYRYQGGAISMQVSGSAANGFQVDRVQFVAD